MLTHKASLIFPADPETPTLWKKCLIAFYRYKTVDKKNPFTPAYFRSEDQILEEKRRHHRYFRFTVHPMSKFKEHYDIFLLVLYSLALIFKPLDFGFEPKFLSHLYLVLNLSLFMDIIVQFFLGYCDKQQRLVVLAPKKISKRYLRTYFFFDILSLIPEPLYFGLYGTPGFLILKSFTLLRLVRIKSVVRLLYVVPEYFGITSRIQVIFVILVVCNALVRHLFACLHFALPRHYYLLNKRYHRKSWVVQGGLNSSSHFVQYMAAAFRTSVYTSCVQATQKDRWLKITTYEETLLVIINYVVGKFMEIVTCVILACMIFLSKSLKVKFQEIMTELNEYMKQKQMPDDLRKRLIQYYNFKYQRVYFNEQLIHTMLSRNLKKEIKVFLCKSLVARSSLLRSLSPRLANEVISYLLPMIFLHGDTIIHAGDNADAMYFLASGTVAVYTQSGREVCHLQDGSYFGEVSLIIKNQKRTATVIAVEMTKVYKLYKKHFEYYFLKRTHTKVFQLLLEESERKLALLKEMEATQRKLIFEQTYGMVQHDDNEELHSKDRGHHHDHFGHHADKDPHLQQNVEKHSL